jgi:BirA family biotin operon repressor/biotin-[acetyl-CoA-carboxylase] ligase
MKTLDVTLLKLLLKGESNHVSGVQLAKKVGLSRVSVWKHLDALQKEGFIFEAIRNRGYKIQEEPSYIHPALLQAYLELEEEDVPPIYYFESIDSTNSEALRKLADGCQTPCLVLAKKQDAGRGRLGRKWVASDPGNFYMSYAFRPNVPAEQMQSFTIWMGVSLCHFLNQSGYPIQIKWPNDLIHNGQKLGGMLTEAQLDADCMRSLVFGIGLNVNSNARFIPEELLPLVTSLKAVSGNSLRINAFAAMFVRAVFSAYDTYMSGEYKALLHTYWEQYDALKGKDIALLQRDKRIAGKAVGINEHAHLLLETASGIEAFHSGDVTIEKKTS